MSQTKAAAAASPQIAEILARFEAPAEPSKKTAAKKAAAGSTVADVRSIFDKAAQIDDITSISGKDLEVGKDGNRVVVSFDYSREVHLAGPAYLVMKYEGRSQ